MESEILHEPRVVDFEVQQYESKSLIGKIGEKFLGFVCVLGVVGSIGAESIESRVESVRNRLNWNKNNNS